jgi:outer membrane protein OmpA-like peptidoglycan-associated protein
MRHDLKLVLLGSALIAGCALSPEANQQLEQARASYRLAAGEPLVRQHAQPELNSAAGALNDAERMANEGAYSDLVEHNAYLAERRARIALRTAQARQAEAEIAAARQERRRLLESEAAAARAKAQQAEIARREAEAQAAAATELAAEVKRLENELADVRAKQTERGWILTLKNELLFDSGGATLKAGAQRALDNLAEFLRKYPDRDIAIEGFTDSIGSKELNQTLSERRAYEVKAALVKRGVD